MHLAGIPIPLVASASVPPGERARAVKLARTQRTFVRVAVRVRDGALADHLPAGPLAHELVTRAARQRALPMVHVLFEQSVVRVAVAEKEQPVPRFAAELKVTLVP